MRNNKEGTRLVRTHTKEAEVALKQAHRLAMEAKQKIFKAQDAVEWHDTPDHDAVREWLTHLRSELERFDRSVRAYGGVRAYGEVKRP